MLLISTGIYPPRPIGLFTTFILLLTFIAPLKKIIWFIYLCLALLELPYCVGFSLVPESRASLPLRCFACAEHRLWACRLRELWFPGSGAQTQSLRLTGLVALRHVGSSWIRDRTHAPCLGRWILHNWATRETLQLFFFLLTVVCIMKMSIGSGKCKSGKIRSIASWVLGKRGLRL